MAVLMNQLKAEMISRTLSESIELIYMSSDHFYLFTAWASFSSEAQKLLQGVQSPQEIVELAAERGYEISVEQLRLFARRLQDSHWVWNQHDEQWGQEFFSGQGLGQPLEWKLQR